MGRQRGERSGSEEMEESCKVCTKWQRHAYWSHRDPTNVKFFVKLDASFRRYLNLPRRFAKNFQGKISGIIKLKDPNGKIWQIVVLKSYNNLSLRSGWRDFVTANKIDENDLLVFKYSSSSSFDVIIFDPSGYEKAASLIIKNEETESESESETVKTSSDSDTSIRVFIPPMKISFENEISSPAIPAENKRERNGDGTSRHASKKAKQELSAGKPYYVHQKLELSVKQQKIADEMASGTQSGSKLFLKILSSSDMCYRMTIPGTFARQNIGKSSQPISLLVANKEKAFAASYHYNENIQSIGRGWKKFALQNNIKEGNLCLFEVKRLDGTELAIVAHVPPRASYFNKRKRIP
ncbi:B3 domain-containing protein Os12g0592300-like [Carex rostrata]